MRMSVNVKHSVLRVAFRSRIVFQSFEVKPFFSVLKSSSFVEEFQFQGFRGFRKEHYHNQQVSVV